MYRTGGTGPEQGQEGQGTEQGKKEDSQWPKER
jgi:hypothetical protein